MFTAEVDETRKDSYERAPAWIRGSNDYDRDAPDNIEPLEEWRFVSYLTMYTPKQIIWRQHEVPGVKWPVSIRWFVMPDNRAIGCAMTGGTNVAYFECGCKHDYETTRTANCYWEGVCRTCGHHHMIDSSD